MNMKRRAAVVLSCALAAVLGCGGKTRANDGARVCQSYCAFVSDEISDARFYADLATSLQSGAANVHPANDEEAKLMGEQGRHSCVQIREALAIVSSDLMALKGAQSITSARGIDMAREPGPWAAGVDCVTASPAQLRALEQTVQDAKKKIPTVDPQCQTTCEKDMATKLAP